MEQRQRSTSVGCRVPERAIRVKSWLLGEAAVGGCRASAVVQRYNRGRRRRALDYGAEADIMHADSPQRIGR